MSQLPSDVVVHALLPGGVHYVLPRRSLADDGFKKAVTTGLRVGVIVALIGVALAALGVWGILERNRAVWLVNPGVSIGMLVMCGGLMIVGLASLVLYGHAEIKLHGDQLQAIERAGWLRWRWKQPLKTVEKLAVLPVSDKPIRSGPMADLCRVAAGDIFLAPGYPRALCLALAEDLQNHWPGVDESNEPISRPDVVNSLPPPFVPPVFVDREVQPAGSLVEVEELTQALTLHVPRAGFCGGGRTMFCFAVFWNALMLGAAVLWFVLLKEKDIGGLIFAETIVGICAAIGVAMLLGSINMAVRRAAIVVAGDWLMISQRGIFGAKRREWPRDEIDAIVAGPSGMKINDVPVPELQVHAATGQFGALGGRAEDELEWIATVLRRRLKLPASINGDHTRVTTI